MSPPDLKLVRLGHIVEVNCPREEEDSDREGVLVRQEGDPKPSEVALKRLGTERGSSVIRPRVTHQQSTVKTQRGGKPQSGVLSLFRAPSKTSINLAFCFEQTWG